MLSEFKVLCISSDATFLEELKQQLPPNCSAVTPSSLTGDQMLKLAGDIDVIVSSKVPGRLVTSARRLKMIQSIISGVEGIDVDAATERGVVVCSTTGINAVPAAEHAVSLLLALAKNIVKYDKSLKNDGWMAIPSALLENKTLGIVGLGSIGQEVATRGKAFGMRVIANKRHPTEELRRKLGIGFLGGRSDLPRILGESDFVVFSVPLTPETRKMIGEEELRMMKRSAYLINISRGEVIDENTLISALEEGIIAGAGLDVFKVEPLHPDNPLLTLENVVLTPHVAGSAKVEGVTRKRVEFIARNIERIMKDEKPEKIVDPVLKYVTGKR